MEKDLQGKLAVGNKQPGRMTVRTGWQKSDLTRAGRISKSDLSAVVEANTKPASPAGRFKSKKTKTWNSPINEQYSTVTSPCG
jgi:hypothetical protein